MKNIIRKILREQEEEIIQAPPFSFFLNNWEDVLDWADDRLFRMNWDINLSESDITTLGGLVEVDGDLNLYNCQNLQSLGELRSVGGYLDLGYCKNLQSLGELRSVGDFLNLRHCENLQSLGELRSVGGDLDLWYCIYLQSLGELESVGGWLDLRYCKNLQSLGELESVDGWLDLRDTAFGKKVLKLGKDDDEKSFVEIISKISNVAEIGDGFYV